MKGKRDQASGSDGIVGEITGGPGLVGDSVPLKCPSVEGVWGVYASPRVGFGVSPNRLSRRDVGKLHAGTRALPRPIATPAAGCWLAVLHGAIDNRCPFTIRAVVVVLVSSTAQRKVC
jgi:hypothetical protein